jgi:hypothetical protein
MASGLLATLAYVVCCCWDWPCCQGRRAEWPDGRQPQPAESLHRRPGRAKAGIVGSAGIGLFFAFWSWVGFETVAVYGEESALLDRAAPTASTSVSGGSLPSSRIRCAVMIQGWAPGGDAARVGGSDGFFVTSNLHAETRKVFLA